MSTDDPVKFLRALHDRNITNAERAVAVLWFAGRREQSAAMTCDELVKLFEVAGYARQNKSRLARQLAADSRTAKAGPSAFRVRINSRAKLDSEYAGLTRSRPVPPSDSVVPAELFHDTRGYLERVTAQVNASFDSGLYDCCAVMCRRLLETLIIEVYEHLGRTSDIQGHDGHFKMFSGLLGVLEPDGAVSISRNGLKGLRDFKRLGDLSAHNRRFNARREDIVHIKDGLRVACEELIHLGGLS